MKRNVIYKGLATVLVAGAMTSCASDYLDLKPITQITTYQITENLEMAEATYNGIMELMYSQIANGMSGSGSWGFPLLNGQSWLNTYHEAYGTDFYFYYWTQAQGDELVLRWDAMHQREYVISTVDWKFYYAIITRCNNFLFGIDDMALKDAGDDLKRDFLKAGVLTMRAYAYFKLMEVYGPRYEDSKNGQDLCLVIRNLENNTDRDVPLSTYEEVVNVMRSDLDTALELFTSSGQKRSSIWQIDINVCKGIYARVCMMLHDFPNAQKYAHDARQGYPIMSADEYKAGFAAANGEWIWSHLATNTIYYWSFGSLYSCNEGYPVLWGNIGAGSINMDLYRQIPEGDIRRDLFLTPDKMKLPSLKESVFYNTTYIDPSSMNLNSKIALMKAEIARFGLEVKPNSAFSDPYVDNSGTNQEGVMIPYGAQYKFWGTDSYGTSQYPFMRAAEMLLTEAEAAYENNQPNVAKACLEELNAQRQPGYVCDKTGTALRDEVRLYRRIELWGEGFSWFDLKRWNVPMVRNTWKEGDVTSNNIPASAYAEKDPSAENGWRFRVPKNETLYNKDINPDMYNTEPQGKPGK